MALMHVHLFLLVVFLGLLVVIDSLPHFVLWLNTVLMHAQAQERCCKTVVRRGSAAVWRLSVLRNGIGIIKLFTIACCVIVVMIKTPGKHHILSITISNIISIVSIFPLVE